MTFTPSDDSPNDSETTASSLEARSSRRSFRRTGGALVVYDPGNSSAWIECDTPRSNDC